jgi:short subunit dehydrogenase-like uncharacterized protein
MSVEAALQLLRVRATRAATKGGFYTPATLLGNELIEQLRLHAGMTFEVLQ